ncbi:MFS transporter [Picrophilus oshimae]|uniref:Major Facilitator Superfamily protein n=1 Tax=Picrophilus torridus (strain ATCC 700027 / DSM 9790 / JCM 10055 / NBRC 100828 / KAW 2/3) TaxID=1122961 RepID=A0A8G2L6R4_PICTO|nr:MFS transporter [Picrophilus oshimae]SMD30357.1 Major Facilitator Superfamily protein [Picrophilus oshimae DSM 9789]
MSSLYLEGYLIDRFNRKKLFLIFNVLLLFIYSALAFERSLMWLYSVSFLSQAITAISVDSFRAITKDILDKNEMSNGISISQIGRGLSYILGDLLAGAFLIFFQRTFFVFFIIMAILSIIMLYNTGLKDVKPAPKHKKTKYRDAFPYILAVLPVMVLSFILAGSSSALDVYSAYIISTYLKSGILWYTLFIVAFPFGSIIAGFYIASHRKNISRFFVLLMLPFAFLLLFISISAYAFEIVIAAVLLGIISAFINIKITAYITINTPGEMIGRVNALYYTMIASSAPLLTFVYSALGTFFNPMIIIFCTGIVVILLLIPIYIYVERYLRNHPS